MNEKSLASALILLLLCGAGACGTPNRTPADDPSPEVEIEPVEPVEPIETVLARVTDGWMEIPGVEGTAIGLCDDRPCIVVYTSLPAARLDPPIPSEIGGHPVRFEMTGGFEARDTL